LLLATFSFHVFAEKIPAAAFGKLPPIASINLSPDGQTLVMLRVRNDTYHVVVTDLTTRKSKLLMAADPAEFLFDWCRFANNKRVVCQIRKYMVVSSGMGGLYRDGRTIFTRLIAANVDRSNIIELVPPAKTTGPGQNLQWNPINQSGVLSWIRDDPDNILIQLARDDRLRPSVYRLNINTNKMTRVRKYHDAIYFWTADEEGELVMGAGFTSSFKPVGYVRKGTRFVKVNIDHLIGENPPVALAMAADKKSLWISANYQSDTRGIHRISLEDASVIETLFHDEDYDVGNLFVHPQTKQPISSTYYTDKMERKWFDETWEREFNKIKASLPGSPSRLSVTIARDNMDKMILRTGGNGTNPRWYLYDRSVPTISLIGSSFANLGPIIDLEPVTYKARDGLEIPAYIALPGPKNDGPYPTIIYPHGGPYARDTDSFDYWAQFFVSRGYAVLKPNFRGSAGYGDALMRSGYKEWGLKMQDDLIDGLDWMIEQGYSNADEVCIVGGSYGGYAALVAAYKSPERFKCAVSFAGVAELDELAFRWFQYEMGGRAVQRMQSGQSRDDNSPLLNVDKIEVPLLLVHGDVDRQVMIEQSQDFVKALEKAGKDYIYIEQENGNHHLSLESHRIEFFEAMDEFLTKHLGGD